MTRIKMCGVCSEEEVAAVNEILPDYAGFVFCPNDTQYVTPERALELRDSIDEDITIVGVFSNAPVRFVAALMNEDLIEIAQLCGEEDDAFIDSLYGQINSLYRLDQLAPQNEDDGDAREQMGPLPPTAVGLLAALAAVWVLMGVYAGWRYIHSKAGKG